MCAAVNAGKGVFLNQKLADSQFPAALLDHVDLGVCAVDGDLNVVAINAMARRILDFPADLIQPGLTLETLIRFNAARGDFGEGNVEDLVHERLELARNATADSFEFTQTDGSQIYVKRSILASGGFITTYSGNSVVKGTGDRDKEVALATLRDVVESMEQGVILWNADQCCETFNQRAFELLDLDESHLKLGMPRAEFLERTSKRGDLSAEQLELVKQSFEQGDKFWFDRMTPSGRVVLTDVGPRPDGGFVVTFSDVTDLRRREAELVTARSAAEAAVIAKSEFLANMSHEIRTPMNGMLGMAELLARTDLDSKQAHFTQTIVKSGQELLTIINDILDFSKIEAGQLVLNDAPFELKEAIEDVTTLMAANAAEKGIELAVRIQPDLPNDVVGDAGRLRQVITNLLGNAIKFTDEGHVLAEVSGSVKEDLACLKFRIEDTGPGIADDQIEHIFGQFSQVDATATRSHEGTGLGLAISTRLVSLMGSEIHVESRPGAGSCFWFEVSLPVHAAEPKTVRTPLDATGANVLIIDDNEINRNILMEQMAAWQFNPVVSTGGADGISRLSARALEGRPFDIVVLDYHMPNLDGLQVAERIRSSASTADTPILLLTSVEHAEMGGKLEELGINAHLTKPARSSLLFETIVTVLQDAGFVQSADDAAIDKDEGMPAVPAPMEEDDVLADPGVTRILFAEDNTTNHEVFLELMETEPYRITGAWDGREAVAQYLADPTKFDLIVMDLAMPNMSGISATHAIRAHEKVNGLAETPIIGVSAHATEVHRIQAEEAGMNAYLTKPIDVEELLACLAQYGVNRGIEGLKDTAQQMAAANDSGVTVSNLTIADLARKYQIG